MQILRKPIFYVVLILCAIIAIAFCNFVLHPNAFLLTNAGDGYKNYFTPAWYVSYDNGSHFSGMLYPFGDNILYADAQPALVWPIQLLSNIFPGIVHQTIGIMHICIFISIVFCGVFLYLIIIRFVQNKWIAAFAAIAITLLSPQLERLNGHFALSYLCVIPCIWYLHIRLMEERKLKFTLWLIFAITLFSFLHLYFLLTALLFVAASMFAQCIFGKVNWKLFFYQAIVVTVPFLITIIYIQLTDHVADRPDTPYGFTVYRTTLGSLFAPDHGNFYDFWIDFIGFQKADMEGYAYLGLSAIVAVLLTIIYAIILIPSYIKSRREYLHITRSIFQYLFAAFIILCFALAIPFIWGFEDVIEKVPLLRQFRSPGRFAWIFYYVINVYAVYFFYSVYSGLKSKNKIVGIVVMCLAISVLLLDGFTYFFSEAKGYNTYLHANTLHKKSDSKSELFPAEVINPKDFQALVFVPLFMQGSEKLYIDRSNGDFSKAMEISYQSGLPLLDVMMSRTSISQTVAIASLMSNPLLDKKIPQAFNDKPLLLVTNNNQLSAEDKFLISKADSICSKFSFTYYALPLSAFANTKSEAFSRYTHLQNAQHYDSTYLAEIPLKLFYINDFENLHASTTYSGNGALQHNIGGYYLDEIQLPDHETFWMEASFWVPVFNAGNGYPSIHIEFVDASGNILAAHGVNPKESVDVEGDWIRAGRNFEVVSACRTLRIYLEEYTAICIDAMLLRHTASDVYYKNPDGVIMQNNFPIGK